MNIFFYLVIFCLLILNYKYPTKNNIIELLENNKDYSIILSSLPYYYEYNSNEKIASLYHYIDLLENIENKNNQLSIKLQWFKDYNEIKKIVKYANDRNIVVVISSFLKKHRDNEINTYLKLLNDGLTNNVITLATYHSDIDEKVDLILKKNGRVRLVKGWWNDGDVKDWNNVTQNMYNNGIKLANDNNNHIIATHDFDLLKRLYQKNNMNNIEISFFLFNNNYVKDQIENFPFNIKRKSFYQVYGHKMFNIPLLVLNSNLNRNLKLLYKSIFNK